MNAAEEHAVLALALAETAYDKRQALRSLRGRGVRLSEAARGKLSAASVERAVPLQTGPIKHTEALEAGAEPVLCDATRQTLVDWADMWLSVEHFPPDVRPGALLLHGPTGTGKSTAAKWLATLLADRYRAHLLEAHACFDSYLGGTGKQLAEVFGALNRAPGYLVLEEIDAMATTRGGGDTSAGAEVSRITIALMRLIEASRFPLVCTSNRRDALDPALLRRFDACVKIDEPSRQDKVNILAFLGVTPKDLDLSAPIVDLVRAAKAQRRSRILEGVDRRWGQP